MKPKLPTRRMREHPDLEQLKHQAKELLRGFAAGDAKAVAEVNAHYRAAESVKRAVRCGASGLPFESTASSYPRPARACRRCGRCFARGRSLPAWRCRTATSTGPFISR